MSRLHEGGVFLHPEDGPIYITDGAYERNGRVSNAWSWVKVLPNGKLDTKELHGYGDDWPAIPGATVLTSVELPVPYCLKPWLRNVTPTTVILVKRGDRRVRYRMSRWDAFGRGLWARTATSRKDVLLTKNDLMTATKEHR